MGLHSQGLHACPLARHSVLRLELAGATPTAHEAALGAISAAISAAGVPPLRVWPSAYAPEGQLHSGGLVRAEWTLPPPQAEPISFAYTAWPAAALGAHTAHHGAHTAHHGAPTVSLGRAEGLPEPISARTPVGMQPPVTARRLVAGDGERKSSLLLELTSSWARPVRVDVVDELPHWVQPYWHTLRCWRNGTSVGLDEALSRWRIDPASAPAPPLPRAIELYSSDAVATRAPHQFRWSADLPTGPTSLVVAFDILKPVRHIDSMPADASRGLDIGSAAVAYSEVASISSSSISSSAAVAYSEVAHAAAGAAGAPDTAPTPDEPPPMTKPPHCDDETDEPPPLTKLAMTKLTPDKPPPPPQMLLFSNAVVVMLPIADDSMPYNVIAVSSTLIALFVGQMFNLLMRPLTGRGKAKAKAERLAERRERGRGEPLKTRFV
jgi:hypothetical protein